MLAGSLLLVLHVEGHQLGRQQTSARNRGQQPLNWLAAAGAQLQPNAKAIGKGWQGLHKEVCAVLTGSRCSLSTAKEARQWGTVLSSKAHECPYCKCGECKKVWNGSNRDQLAGTLKVTAHQVVVHTCAGWRCWVWPVCMATDCTLCA